MLFCPKTNKFCRNINCYELDKPTSFIAKFIACVKIEKDDVFLLNNGKEIIQIKVTEVK